MNGDYLRSLTDEELQAVATELRERHEQFGSQVRMQVNDEFRRRKLPLPQL